MKTKIVLPKRILQRLKQVSDEMESILTSAETGYSKSLTMTFQFVAENASPIHDVLLDSERAALHGFLAKLRTIPNYPEPVLEALEDGTFVLGNEQLARHIITEFRPILFNQRDPVYFGKVQAIAFQMLNRIDPSEGTKITVVDTSENDVTDSFRAELASCRRVIDSALGKFELDYLYNGVLQHSDERFAERYSDDFHSGELAYTFMKHAHVLTYLRHYLKPLEQIASIFWVDGYPRRGRL